MKKLKLAEYAPLRAHFVVFWCGAAPNPMHRLPRATHRERVMDELQKRNLARMRRRTAGPRPSSKRAPSVATVASGFHDHSGDGRWSVLRERAPTTDIPDSPPDRIRSPPAGAQPPDDEGAGEQGVHESGVRGPPEGGMDSGPRDAMRARTGSPLTVSPLRSPRKQQDLDGSPQARPGSVAGTRRPARRASPRPSSRMNVQEQRSPASSPRPASRFDMQPSRSPLGHSPRAPSRIDEGSDGGDGGDHRDAMRPLLETDAFGDADDDMPAHEGDESPGHGHSEHSQWATESNGSAFNGIVNPARVSDFPPPGLPAHHSAVRDIMGTFSGRPYVWFADMCGFLHTSPVVACAP